MNPSSRPWLGYPLALGGGYGNDNNAKEIAALFVAESMRQCMRRGLAAGDKSTNRMLAEIYGAALAEVMTQFQQEPDEPDERAK